MKINNIQTIKTCEVYFLYLFIYTRARVYVDKRAAVAAAKKYTKKYRRTHTHIYITDSMYSIYWVNSCFYKIFCCCSDLHVAHHFQ